MLSNMASSLILHKRVSTTVAKAKALRKYVEPLITKSKTDTTHSRRIVFSYLQNKESSSILFDEVASKVGDRPGGYTRIIKTGARLGDNAETCIIELVDFNELLVKEKSDGKKTRRSRRGGKKSSASDTAAVTKAADTSKVEASDEEVTEAEVKEESTENAQAAEAKTETTETPVEEKKAEDTEEKVEAKAEAPDETAEEKSEETEEKEKDSDEEKSK